MLKIINRIFVAFLMLAALMGILFSMATLFLPELFPDNTVDKDNLGMPHLDGLSLPPQDVLVEPDDSPYLLNVTVETPPLRETDLLFLDVYLDGRQLDSIDCFEGFEEPSEYLGASELNCTASLPYDYLPGAEYRIFAVLARDETEYAAGPVLVSAAWKSYESDFMGFSFFMGLIVVLSYLFVLLPVSLLVLATALRTNHKTSSPGEYSLGTLLSPFTFGKTMLQKFHAFLLSPYFWAFELLGIIIILIYMALSAAIWKSTTALIAFTFSGLMALIVPLLWCAVWWYADYREREPLRILLTLFLFGMLSALMAIGLNTVAGLLLAALGLGFLGSFMIAPVAEEAYKGSGLTLLSEHHEFDSVEDGIVFGFTIGMGFSFIENWIYFLGNPMGSDIIGWFFLFLMRSIFFSANHGFYTAITGAAIGYAIERKFKAPGLFLLLGVPVAALFHAMHNSGEMLATILGAGGYLIYCCFLIPIFDYGGFIALVLLFIRSVIRQKKA
ncbi:MAG: PrsW family intramembrane metalloprotease [Candidatus Micrarchaeota archaeon]